MTFYGHVERGQILLEHSELFHRECEKLSGKSIELVLRRERRRRDPQQNYYWGVVLRAFAQALRRDPEDLHEALKREFLPGDECGRLCFTRSTAEIDKVEFSRYLDRVLNLAAEMGIDIGEPAPQYARGA